MTANTERKRLLPWRFGLFLLLTLLVPALWPMLGGARAIMAGFDLAALGFMATLPSLFAAGDAASMRRQSAANDANREITLALTIGISGVILVAIGSELSEPPDGTAKALIIATLLIAWLFSNLVFALHYAHLYYLRGDGADCAGADFPETKEPDYWDFAYFAVTLGMTFQTSDVAITSAAWRRVALAHCLAAFVFNLGVLAFTINTLAQ